MADAMSRRQGDKRFSEELAIILLMVAVAVEDLPLALQAKGLFFMRVICFVLSTAVLKF